MSELEEGGKWASQIQQELKEEIKKLKDENLDLLKANAEITHLATELAGYASYAEIVGAVTHNRAAVRKYCDEIFDFNKRVDAELEQSPRGEHD